MEESTRGHGLDEYSRRVAAGTPAPAGGSVAAVAAALAAALAAMIGRVAVRRAPGDPGLNQLIESAEGLRQRLLALGQEDEAAYEGVLAARRNRAGGSAEHDARLLAAWREAARVPGAVVKCAREIALLARRAAVEGPAGTAPDAVMAALIAAAVAAGSHLNLRSNIEAAGRPADLLLLRDESEAALRETQRIATEVRQLAEERMFGTGRPSSPATG